MKLHPAILTDSMTTFVEQLELVKTSQYIDRVHVDIIDGQFVENMTVTPMDLTVVEFGKLKVELHLMVEEPMDTLFECQAICEYLPITRVIGQVERMSHQAGFIHEVQRNGWKVGLGLDIYTPLEAIDETSWLDIDAVLLMGIEAGHQNQIFNAHVLQKIKEVLETRQHAKKIEIIMDGGVKQTNLARILQSGADEVAVGSALWKSQDPAAVIKEFFAVAERVQ